MRLLRKLTLYLLGFSLAILISRLIWVVFFDPIITLFNVAVDTERLEVVIVDKNNSLLPIYGAEIRDYDSTLVRDFNGLVELEVGTRVTFDRIANGPIIITLEGEMGEPVGRILTETEEVAFRPDYLVEIVIRDIVDKTNEGASFVFPVSGNIELGRSIDLEGFGESIPVLRGGEVSLVGNSKDGNNYFEAGTVKLNMGDQLVAEDPIGKGYGFVAVNENPGMKAVYRVMAKEAKVIKPGPKDDDGGYSISASLLDRFLNDALFLWISIFFGALLVLISILTFAMDTFLFYKERKENV
jgi:hypothetical protein